MQSEKSASKDSDLDHHAVQRNDKIVSFFHHFSMTFRHLETDTSC